MWSAYNSDLASSLEALDDPIPDVQSSGDDLLSLMCKEFLGDDDDPYVAGYSTIDALSRYALRRLARQRKSHHKQAKSMSVSELNLPKN